MRNPAAKKAVTATEMKSIEEKGVALGISKIAMMENAGSAIARQIVAMLGFEKGLKHIRSKFKVAFVAGVGNNGGDAFVAARHLSYFSKFVNVKVFLVGKETEIITEEAKANFRILSLVPGVAIMEIDSEEKVGRNLLPVISKSEILVVAIFGTGFRAVPRSLQLRCIKIINEIRGTKVLSVDLPSGMEADSGKSKYAIRSDVTVTMHAPKKGMLADDSTREICGQILVENIGLPF